MPSETLYKCQYCSGIHSSPSECNDPVNVLRGVRYKDWKFNVGHDVDEFGNLSRQKYLQVTFNAPEGYQMGRKWRLSPHMTRSEIVSTALKAVLAAEEHEAREQFKYRGQAIYGPHFNVDALHKLAEQGGNLDARADVKSA